MAPETLPNLLFVLVDEQKATGLRLYNDDASPTPNLEGLAQQGMVFTHAFTPIPLCVPARASLFLGMYPHAHGLWTNEPRLRSDAPHLFSLLKRAGYTTALIGKNHVLRDEDLTAIFDHVFEADHAGTRSAADPDTEEMNAWLSQPRLLAGPWTTAPNPFPREQCPTHVLASRALELLGTLPEPFCIWLSFPDPHTPFQAPEPYISRHPVDEVEPPPADDLGTKPERQRTARRMFAADKASARHIQSCIATYRAMQDFIDDELGRLLAALDSAASLAERTVVVYTSDHGGYVGEHGLIRKSLAFYDCLLRIPLVIRWPGKIPSRSRHDGMVAHPDLAPTLLDLLGVDRPRMQGRPLDVLNPDGMTAAKTVFAEAGIPGSPPSAEELDDVPEHPEDGRFVPWGGRREAWVGPGVMVRDHERKLVRYATGEAEVYELGADPWELTNVAPANTGPDPLDGELGQRLIAARAATSRGYATS